VTSVLASAARLCPKNARPSQSTQPQFVTPLATLQQGARAVGLREAMSRAGVSQATADQVALQQAQTEAATVEAFFKVRTLGLAPSALATGTAAPQSGSATTPDLTRVLVDQPLQQGVGETREQRPSLHAIFNFPPNDPKYLAELVRAQNNNLWVYVSFIFSAGFMANINYLHVSPDPVNPSYLHFLPAIYYGH
jgi:hypothetical protein